MAKQSLKARLWINTSVVLALMIIVGALGAYALWSSSNNLRLIEEENKALAAVNLASEETLNMRLNVNTFLRTNDDKPAGVAAEYGTKLIAHLEEMIAVEDHESHKKLEEEALAWSKTYVENLEKCRQYTRGYAAAGDVMRSTGSKVLEGINKMIENAQKADNMAYTQKGTMARFRLMEGRVATIRFREVNTEVNAEAAKKLWVFMIRL